MENQNHKFQEQKVLETELASLKKGAKVYKQQQNSNVFFQTKAEEVMKECKNTMEGLIKEYKSLEKPECENDTENDDADTEPIPEAGS
ncbi:ASNSD1 upstream open reading frame protein-like [Saccostrea cucullata]|uniref:ASNSD1 upstream open reading frame protein-like n=1 Tax=Saccostrea cuccullata TaxID=36930 RepID=UPI002ECFAE8C